MTKIIMTLYSAIQDAIKVCLDIWIHLDICLDNWIYLDLDVDPGEDVRSAQGALGQVVAALGAGAQVPARQQDHAALKHCIIIVFYSRAAVNDIFTIIECLY